MLVFNDFTHDNKKIRFHKQNVITKQSVKRSRRKKPVKVNKNNKEFLRALGFKI